MGNSHKLLMLEMHSLQLRHTLNCSSLQVQSGRRPTHQQWHNSGSSQREMGWSAHTHTHEEDKHISEHSQALYPGLTKPSTPERCWNRTHVLF